MEGAPRNAPSRLTVLSARSGAKTSACQAVASTCSNQPICGQPDAIACSFSSGRTVIPLTFQRPCSSEIYAMKARLSAGADLIRNSI
jgi:hypothetical protein